MFLSYAFNNKLNDFWAGGYLKQSSEVAHRITGSNRPYRQLDSDAQEEINKFDELAHKHNTTILSGLIIGGSAPILGYYHFGWLGSVTALIITGLAVWLLTYKSIQELNREAENIAEVYKAKYEN